MNGGGLEVKVCPRCSVLIVKMDDGSCNHMTCAVCGSEFCWLCMKVDRHGWIDKWLNRCIDR